MNIITQVWAWLRKLPVARYIKPLWKGGLKIAVQEAGDALQAEVREKLTEKDSAAIKHVNARFDGWQAGLLKTMRALPLPAGVQAKCESWLQVDGDVLQSRILAAIKVGGPVAVDAAFDDWQRLLIARIDTL